MRRIRYGRVFVFIILPIMAILFFTAFHKDTKAQHAEGRLTDIVAYESVMVHKGDTLWDIAEANLKDPTMAEIRDYVDEIAELNRISPGYLKSGKHIIIPKYNLV